MVTLLPETAQELNPLEYRPILTWSNALQYVIYTSYINGANCDHL